MIRPIVFVALAVSTLAGTVLAYTRGSYDFAVVFALCTGALSFLAGIETGRYNELRKDTRP